MCTSLTLTTVDKLTFLARTMDFSFELEAQPVFIPREHLFKSDVNNNTHFSGPFSFIGAGRQLGEYFFADGVNEKGIGICALYFSNHAMYEESPKDDSVNIAPHEFVPWVLANVSSLDDLPNQLKDLTIVSAKNKLLNLVTPLHWIISDQHNQSLIIEITQSGTHLYENKARVMTNSPEYPWHLEHLDHFAYVQTTPRPIMNFDKHRSISDGAGSGLMGIPGDYTSQSRFLRTAYLAQTIDTPLGSDEAVNTLQHILASADIPKGVKQQSNGEPDYTQYKSMMNLSLLDYYFIPYHDTCPVKINLAEAMLKFDKPYVFPIQEKQTIINGIPNNSFSTTPTQS